MKTELEIPISQAEQQNPVKKPTSEVSAEVVTKKPSHEEKIIDHIKTTWAALKQSDKAWEKAGKEFGKWCSELRKLYKKPGSRKGHGFEAMVRKLGVDYQKARYWADEVDGKNKKKARNYAGAAPAKRTTTDPKADDPKPNPFVLLGLTDDQQAAMVRMETDARGFAQFAHEVITSPGAEQVRFVVNRCLGKLDKLHDQLDLLADLRSWIDRQCFDLQEQIEAGITMTPRAIQRRALSFLDEDNETTSVSAGDLSLLLNKARESVASDDANTNRPGSAVPAELVITQPEAAAAGA